MHGRKDYAKTLKLRFRSRDLDLPERIKRYTGSREEGEEDAQRYPCSEAIENGTHVVGECEMHKEERGILTEMRKLHECDMEKFDTLDSSDETIAVLGDRWWPQTAKQQGLSLIHI